MMAGLPDCCRCCLQAGFPCTETTTGLQYEEYKGDAKQAKEFEVYPGRFGIVVRHIYIGCPGEDEEADPRQVQFAPHRRGQRDLVGRNCRHHAFHERVFADELAAEEQYGEGPVEPGGLPLKEDRIIECQADAAEAEHQHGRHDQHPVQFPLDKPGCEHLQAHRAHDHDDRGRHLAGDPVSGHECDDGQKIQ